MFSEHRYWHGNEPCHQVAYLFNAVGAPEKTRRHVRHIMDTEYLNVPGGLSGNDDAGQMSAWFVFSAMGFYPVAPATPFYYLGAPLFERIEITPEEGVPGRDGSPAAEANTFVITSTGTPDVREVLLDGRPVDPVSLRHSDITKGGNLRFQ